MQAGQQGGGLFPRCLIEVVLAQCHPGWPGSYPAAQDPAGQPGPFTVPLWRAQWGDEGAAQRGVGRGVQPAEQGPGVGVLGMGLHDHVAEPQHEFTGAVGQDPGLVQGVRRPRAGQLGVAGHGRN